MAWYGVQPTPACSRCRSSSRCARLLALGLGLLLAALTVTYRDFRYVVPFVDSAWACSCRRSRSKPPQVPERWRAALRAQSAGRHHRRVPLVAAWRTRLDRSARCRDLDRRHDCCRSSPALWYFRPHRTRLRRCDLIGPHERDHGLGRGPRQALSPAPRAERDRYVTLRDVMAGAATALVPLAASGADREGGDRGLLGAARRVVRRRRRRGGRHHRPQRRRQEHAVEDSEPHHRADDRPGHAARPRGEPARSRHRLPSRADRPRKHLPERRRSWA